MKLNQIILAIFTALLFICCSKNDEEPSYTAIPDNFFENALIELGIDSDGQKNGKVLSSDIENVIHLEIKKKNIRDLTGIVGFKSLRYLDVSFNYLTELDVSQNIYLEELYLFGEEWFLWSPNINYQDIVEIDLSRNTSLIKLRVGGNEIVNLNLSNCPSLEELNCYGNQISELDLSNNTNMKILSCSENQLTSLDLSQQTALERLDFRYNQLTSIDLSHNSILKKLLCDDNQLTSLDLSHNTILEDLWCPYNQLTFLDVSQNTHLFSLYCLENQLTSLNVANGNNAKLRNMSATDNNLTCIQIDEGFMPPNSWHKDSEAFYSINCN